MGIVPWRWQLPGRGFSPFRPWVLTPPDAQGRREHVPWDEAARRGLVAGPAVDVPQPGSRPLQVAGSEPVRVLWCCGRSGRASGGSVVRTTYILRRLSPFREETHEDSDAQTT